ncbi:MAG TPA: hypothetical protein VKF35_02370 [Hyphomicrobiaceae bacterium]|nr:hypothetical protein [Hyphomicrobiaceae bacterium]
MLFQVDSLSVARFGAGARHRMGHQLAAEIPMLSVLCADGFDHCDVWVSGREAALFDHHDGSETSKGDSAAPANRASDRYRLAAITACGMPGGPSNAECDRRGWAYTLIQMRCTGWSAVWNRNDAAGGGVRAACARLSLAAG